MQARNPCESLCLQKAWHAQFVRKEPRIVCAAMPQMPSENQRRGRGIRMAARTAMMSSMSASTISAPMSRRVSARASSLRTIGAYAMALFKQDHDGRVRGRADAACGAGDEDGFLRHDFLPLLTSTMNNEHERCLRSTRFDYSDDDRRFPIDAEIFPYACYGRIADQPLRAIAAAESARLKAR
jgi:hypothetical protein